MIQSFFLRSYFDHSTAHLNSSGTFMAHSRDLHVVFASTQPTATPLFRTCADSKTECIFYAVTCTFIHDKVGQCPVCGGRSSLQKDDLRALLKPSRVTSKQTQHDGPLSHSKNKSRFSIHAFTSILKKWKVNLSKLGNSHYFNPTITRLGGADSFMQFKFTN